MAARMVSLEKETTVTTVFLKFQSAVQLQMLSKVIGLRKKDL